MTLGLVATFAFLSPASAGTSVIGHAQTGLIGYVTAVAAAPDGRVYVTASSAVALVDADGSSATEFLPLEDVAAIAVDTAGDVYLTPDPQGVSKYRPDGTLVWHTRPNLYNYIGRGAMDVAEGIVWFAVHDRVYGLNATDGQLLHEFPVPANTQDIAALDNGNVLVGVNRVAGGLVEYTPAGTQVRTVTGFGVHFAVGTDGAIIGNEYRSDGTYSGRIARLSTDGQSAYATPPNTSRASDYTVTTSGVIWANVSGGSPEQQLWRMDPSTPDARISAGGISPRTGYPVTFDASGSSDLFDAITRYEWDLDGDGTYERDTGTTPTATLTYTAAGTLNVSVRVTGHSGTTASATTAVNVQLSSTPAPPQPLPTTPPPGPQTGPTPPPGPTGVSINGGAQYTNDPNVVITTRWPVGYTDSLVANDGGFVPSVGGPVQETVTWRLASSGPERLPKTVYVRFVNGARVSETYQDDIILDQTTPTVLSGTATPASSARDARSFVTPRAAAKRRFTVRTKATDKTSGVAKMQITSRKSRPGAWMTYKKSRSFRTAGTKVFVRVRDGAGNVSKWRRLR